MTAHTSTWRTRPHCGFVHFSQFPLWWARRGSRKARRIACAPVCQPRLVPPPSFDSEAINQAQGSPVESSRLTLPSPNVLRPKKLRAIRFLSIGLSHENRSTKPCIRLQGNWLRNAGFLPHGHLKVTVLKNKLILEPMMPGDMHDPGLQK